ncbi:MAG: hypothetical protein CVU17_08685 [Betaproteobacteria bacterium HGW-Betaproteobacteria-11]|nr:MAG: hypothetical protein CVU17_08685 [Betaproteobacteria bacterium HGW-Betaproteobacteria-11]
MAESVTQAGLFASLKGLLGSATALLKNRIELLGVELAEERERLLALLVWAAVAFIGLAAGVVFLAVLVTVLLWDNNRLLALGVFSALFLGAGFYALSMVSRLARSGSKLFAASLAELESDRTVLAARDFAKSNGEDAAS